MALLEIENLSFTYSPNTPLASEALKNVSFSVNKGEIFAIIGHTGSGKSTLLQMLNGLLKPTEGCVKFNGKDIWENPKKIKYIRSKIGLVFQYPEYQLFEETVYKDIAYGPSNMGVSGDELNKAVINAAENVGLKEELMNKAPFELSGGEKRRAAIAGIMAMNPEIIVFDEPTAGLDPIGRKIIFDAILRYREKNNATVIIVSHSMEDTAQIADRILVMNDGEAIMTDTPKNVFKNSELLVNIGLNVPYVTKIMLGLKNKGIDISTDVFTVDDAVKNILKYYESQGGNYVH